MCNKKFINITVIELLYTNNNNVTNEIKTILTSITFLPTAVRLNLYR